MTLSQCSKEDLLWVIKRLCQENPGRGQHDLERVLIDLDYPVWLVGMEDGDGCVFIHHVDSLSVRYARVGDPKEWCFRTKSYGVRVFAYLDGPKEDNHDSD